MHPLGALVAGGIAVGVFVWMDVHAHAKSLENRRRAGRLAFARTGGAWGGVAAGIFGLKGLGGLGGASFWSQVAGTASGIGIAGLGGFVIYGAMKNWSAFGSVRSRSPMARIYRFTTSV